MINLTIAFFFNWWLVQVKQLRTWTSPVLSINDLYLNGNSVNWGPEPWQFSQYPVYSIVILLIEDLNFGSSLNILCSIAALSNEDLNLGSSLNHDLYQCSSSVNWGPEPWQFSRYFVQYSSSFKWGPEPWQFSQSMTCTNVAVLSIEDLNLGSSLNILTYIYKRCISDFNFSISK